MAKGQIPWNKGTVGLTGRKRTGHDHICKRCGKAFYVSASNAKRNNPKYCGLACYRADRWGETGRRETRTCPICKVEFTEEAATTRVCCSAQCRRIHLSAIRSGENSHFWRDGSAERYTGNWQDQRKKALARDEYRCVTCGSTDRIQVHHISPYRYSKSHDLDNLKTLCRSCHSREEYAVNAIRKDQLDRARKDRQCHKEPSGDS